MVRQPDPGGAPTPVKSWRSARVAVGGGGEACGGGGIDSAVSGDGGIGSAVGGDGAACPARRVREVADHFNLQVAHPCVLLTQHVSTSFLREAKDAGAGQDGELHSTEGGGVGFLRPNVARESSSSGAARAEARGACA